MSVLNLTLSPADVIAALQEWVQTPANFVPPVQHEMNAAIPPVFGPGVGQITVNLNS